MAWTSPRTWVAGETLTAALMNTHVRDNLKALGDPLTSYTPTYTGINAIGNATVVAKYMQTGDWVTGYVKVTMGSTTTFSAGVMSVSLPVAPLIQPNAVVGSAYLQDTSAVALRAGTVVTASSGSGVSIISDAGTVVSNTAPWTWANTDVLAFDFHYEAA